MTIFVSQMGSGHRTDNMNEWFDFFFSDEGNCRTCVVEHEMQWRA